MKEAWSKIERMKEADLRWVVRKPGSHLRENFLFVLSSKECAHNAMKVLDLTSIESPGRVASTWSPFFISSDSVNSSHIPNIYFEQTQAFPFFWITQQGYCFCLTYVPKQVKFDPNIKILHLNIFVVYNCFIIDENDTVLKWVERL